MSVYTLASGVINCKTSGKALKYSQFHFIILYCQITTHHEMFNLIQPTACNWLLEWLKSTKHKMFAIRPYFSLLHNIKGLKFSNFTVFDQKCLKNFLERYIFLKKGTNSNRYPVCPRGELKIFWLIYFTWCLHFVKEKSSKNLKLPINKK